MKKDHVLVVPSGIRSSPWRIARPRKCGMGSGKGQNALALGAGPSAWMVHGRRWATLFDESVGADERNSMVIVGDFSRPGCDWEHDYGRE